MGIRDRDVLDLGTDKPLDKGVSELLNRLLDALRTVSYTHLSDSAPVMDRNGKNTTRENGINIPSDATDAG